MHASLPRGIRMPESSISLTRDRRCDTIWGYENHGRHDRSISRDAHRRPDGAGTTGRRRPASAERARRRSRPFPARRARPSRSSTSRSTSSPVAEGLQNPWGLAFLPDGKMLVTENGPAGCASSRADGKLSEPVAGLPAVDARGQGGLLDVALDPAFATNSLIYWSYAEPREGGVNNTAVARGKFVDGAGAARRERAGDLSTRRRRSTRRCTSAAAWCSAATARCSSRRATARSPRAACRRSGWTACSARSCASTPTARSRRTTRSSARTACGRRSGRSAIATSRRRRCIPTTGELWEVEHGTRGGDEINIARKGKDYGWPTIAYGIEYSGGADHRRHHSSRRAWSSRSTTGIRSSRRAAWRSTPATCSRRGRAACSSAAIGTQRPRAADARTASKVVGEERLLTGSAAEARAHPRRAPGPRRRALPADRQRRRAGS